MLADMTRAAAMVLTIATTAGCEHTRTPARPPAPTEAAAERPSILPSTAPVWTPPLSPEQARAFEVVEVVVDAHSACARSRAGEVACWGDEFRLDPDGYGWAPPTSTPHRLEQVDDAHDLVLAGGLYVLRSDGW